MGSVINLIKDRLAVTQNFNDLTPVVVILLCNYSIFNDYKAVSVAQHSTYQIRNAKRLNPLPSRVAHFDPETVRVINQDSLRSKC